MLFIGWRNNVAHSLAPNGARLSSVRQQRERVNTKHENALGSSRRLLPPFLRVAQPLRHLLVLRSVTCPTLGGCAPAIIEDRHVDAAVDEELHGFVVFAKHQLMQDGGGLLGSPVAVD